MKQLNAKKILFWLLLLTAISLIADGSSIYAKAQLAQYLISDAWTQTVAGKRQVRPWPWADTWPVARLKVADKNIDLYILNGTSGASLPFGPGHLTGSAYPGESGASIIAAHRDTHFKFLETIKLGKTIQIQTRQGDIVWYEVIKTEIADSQKQNLQLVQQAELLTLVTCYPFNAIDPGGPLRYVVTARKIKPALRLAARTEKG